MHINKNNKVAKIDVGTKFYRLCHHEGKAIMRKKMKEENEIRRYVLNK